MKAFGSTPIKEQIALVRCKRCDIPVLRPSFADHLANCAAMPAALVKKSGKGLKDFNKGQPAPGSSIPTGLNAPTWKRLIGHAFPPHEVISIIEEIFASENEVKTVCKLLGDVAQAFIDVIHEALDISIRAVQALDLRDLPPRLREKCLAVLCRICGRQGLLPTALQIPIRYNRSDAPLYRGGFADVWKGTFQNRQVAVKVLRIYSTTDSAKISSRFCKEVVTWNALRHPNVLSLIGVTMTKGEFVMASEWMANGNINEFVEAHWEVNRFELLEDVARGLIYIHSQAMIYGDLKGANILIDRNGRARIADFGLLTIVSDPTYFTASTSAATGGTTRWMSPELLHPEHFGLVHSNPTGESDCYALGMVIYEVLTGQVPFPQCKDYVIIRKVVDGERPARPEGPNKVWFTDDLWKTMGLCWESQAWNRPSIGHVLECLKRASSTWKPLPPQVNKGVQNDKSDWDLTALRLSKSPQSTRMVGGGQVSQNVGCPYAMYPTNPQCKGVSAANWYNALPTNPAPLPPQRAHPRHHNAISQ
ncbi:kinase-like domain-containing protein [Thelephora terrestris]|uniref:Kinase-like domain-containing protein n=1 Tax=Thelephora terrestris TaxID=56493 RepID=A0A9P6HFX6_9AGAM|nr:kinase-like domain-containing protein [Thelephora terrestris]